MNLFLIDGESEYTYTDLLQKINGEQHYAPLFKGRKLLDYFANLLKAIALEKRVVLLDADLNEGELAGVDAAMVNKCEALPPYHFKDIDALLQAVQQSASAITIFTSGTTGQPKRVTHSIATLSRAVRTGERYRAQVWGFAYNPTHMAGLQVFLQAVYNQNALVNLFNLQRSAVYAAIEQHQITHLSATPTFYRLLLPMDMPHTAVRRITLGGEKSDGHLYDAIAKIFPNAKVNNVYASTEAGSLFAAKGDCFQLPLDNKAAFRVVDGELLIHKSLLGQSENFVFEQDYYHSGDLIAWVDKEKGLFRFVSRKNELINVGGYKVNPHETEQAICAIQGVQQVVVYGKPNSVLGNVLCAQVQLTPTATLTELDIRTALRGVLQDFKIPRRITFVDNITLTRSGKIKR